MKKKNKRVIPGFGISMGVTLTMVSVIVLIPLATLVIYTAQMSFPEIIATITRGRVLSSFYVSFITGICGISSERFFIKLSKISTASADGTALS